MAPMRRGLAAFAALGVLATLGAVAVVRLRVESSAATPAGVELQPLAAQVTRVIEALDYLGAPLPDTDRKAIQAALAGTDDRVAATRIQDVLDRHCLLDIHINPESRVHVTAGAARPELVEQGWRTFLIKVRNDAGVTAPLRVSSPQALRVFSRGPGGFSMSPKPEQTISARDVANRWLDLQAFDKPPLVPALSGLAVEYRILQLYSRDAGQREASIAVDVGQGTQDIGFRNDAPILFRIARSSEITLRITDERGRPTTASLVIRDTLGRLYPTPGKRLAPDFDFQPQVYRADGDVIRLAPGKYTIDLTRGPEYVTRRVPLDVSAAGGTVPLQLERWIDLPALGWYPGDHHIHSAGCLHYESPTQGVEPRDMIRHILGEALSVGSVLTWGPGYYYQKQFFEARDNKLSTPDNLMRYDLEVSGFPSSHAGHLVLLGLKDQDFPATRTLEDWPTWDLPVLKWAKAQGAIVGFAHSGWGLQVKGDALPTQELPPFDGIGANEYVVDVTHDAVDFISTVDTPPVWELNVWYHTLNAGFRTRISGETDFPCIYGDRVGLGRSYVKLDRLSYEAWTQGIRDGRAYVTDGKSHLIDFRVDGVQVGTGGSELQLSKPATVTARAVVAARLDERPDPAIRGRRGDEKPYWELERARIGDGREVPVEVIVNGTAVASRRIVADGVPREISVPIAIDRSSWVALRILPSSHTNPIFVVVDGRPVRASRESAEWCLKSIDRLWSQKSPRIASREREAAAAAYDHARKVYKQRLSESGR
jgi:hypothetical protein